MSNGSRTPFRVGNVLGRGFTTLFRNIHKFGAIAVLLSMPYMLVTWYALQGPSGIHPIVWTISLLMVVFVLPQLATAAIAFGTYEAINGRRIGTWQCLVGGLRALLPVIGVVILSSLLVLLAGSPVLLAIWAIDDFGARAILILLLLVPVLIAVTMLWVAVPACVIERPGVVRSIRRSFTLTKGNRWRVLGILLILWLILWFLTIVISILVMGGGLGGGATLTSPGVRAPVLNGAITVIYTLLSAVMTTAAYHDLRMAREGMSVEDVAGVFD